MCEKKVNLAGGINLKILLCRLAYIKILILVEIL